MQTFNYKLMAERLASELSLQLEAYNQSIVNEEIIEDRRKISLRIVQLEKDLVSLYDVLLNFSKTNSMYN